MEKLINEQKSVKNGGSNSLTVLNIYEELAES